MKLITIISLFIAFFLFLLAMGIISGAKKLDSKGQGYLKKKSYLREMARIANFSALFFLAAGAFSYFFSKKLAILAAIFFIGFSIYFAIVNIKKAKKILED